MHSYEHMKNSKFILFLLLKEDKDTLEKRKKEMATKYVK